MRGLLPFYFFGILFFFITPYSNAVVHELGHLLCAKALGIPVSTYTVGVGDELVRFTFGGIDFRFHLLPLGGEVLLSGEKGLDYRLGLIAAAGPVFGLGLALMAYFFSLRTEGKLRSFLMILSGGALVSAGINWMPLDIMVDGIKVLVFFPDIYFILLFGFMVGILFGIKIWVKGLALLAKEC
jgi:membrane-associated protease RseP (regulator of RpoE activity)